jgi:hypothetical protein
MDHNRGGGGGGRRLGWGDEKHVGQGGGRGDDVSHNPTHDVMFLVVILSIVMMIGIAFFCAPDML